MTDYRKELQEVLAQVRFAKNRLAGITMELDEEGKETEGLDEALEGLDDVADTIADFLEEV